MSLVQTELTHEQKMKMANDILEAKAQLELLKANIREFENWLKTAPLGGNEESFLNNIYQSSEAINYHAACIMGLYATLKIKGKKSP